MEQLTPNSPEWVEMRKKYIGASDASIIMGTNPWCTPYKLCKIKRSEIIEDLDNPAMKHGRDTEPLARDCYFVETGVDVAPLQVFHPTIPYMMANLDGINSLKTVSVEIKCPYGDKDHIIAKKGIIPEKYYPQLQHQVEILYALYGIDSVDYYSYKKGETVLITVQRDEKYINTMIAKQLEFWNHVTGGTYPEKTSKDEEYIDRYDSEWREAAIERVEINYQQKILDEREMKNREKLISISNEKKTQGFGVRVTDCPRKGLVDYKSIPELKGVDLEAYRKTGTSYWKVSVD